MCCIYAVIKLQRQKYAKWREKQLRKRDSWRFIEFFFVVWILVLIGIACFNNVAHIRKRKNCVFFFVFSRAQSTRNQLNDCPLLATIFFSVSLPLFVSSVSVCLFVIFPFIYHWTRNDFFLFISNCMFMYMARSVHYYMLYMCVKSKGRKIYVKIVKYYFSSFVIFRFKFCAFSITGIFRNSYNTCDDDVSRWRRIEIKDCESMATCEQWTRHV